MRIVSWNIRAGGGYRVDGIARQLLQWQPDVISLNEFRGTPPSTELAGALSKAGYLYQKSSTDRGNPAKNALLLASRIPFRTVRRKNMPDNPQRWRLVQLHCEPVLLLGLMHIPNYTSPELKYPFLDALVTLARRWRNTPALFIGDTNCGKRGIDEENPNGALFRREHDWMVGMEKTGWVDVFRQLHGDRREYTWYSHKDNGFRLDHAFASKAIAQQAQSVKHVWGGFGLPGERRESLSDHAALIVDLKMRVP